MQEGTIYYVFKDSCIINKMYSNSKISILKDFMLGYQIFEDLISFTYNAFLFGIIYIQSMNIVTATP